MITCRIDDTGVEFDSLSELAKFIGVSVQRVAWKAKYQKDEPNHFVCSGYSITIVHYKSPRKRVRKYNPEYFRQYYATHKEQARQWRINNPDKVKAYKKKWNSTHREYYNNYYREQRRKRREQKND